MLLSIIVPVYNGEEKIERCIKSLQVINSELIEIIIVNDGSTDNSFSICKQLASEDKRIRVISQKNAGVSNARNRGIKESCGTYLAFVDSDDWVTYDYERLLEYIDKNKYDIVIFDFLMKYPNKTVEKKRKFLKAQDISSAEICNDILNGDISSACCSLYRRDIINSNNIYFDANIRMGEDYVFNLHYANFCESGYYIEHAYYIYDYTNGESASHKYRIDDILDYMRVFEESKVFYEEHSDLQFYFDKKYYLKKVVYTVALSSLSDDFCNSLEKFEESELYEFLCSECYEAYESKFMKWLLNTKIYRNIIVRSVISIVVRIKWLFG